MSTVAEGESPSSAEAGKPGARLRCVVVTPERTLFDQVVDYVALPLYDGELGVLPGRAPLIGRLGFGELRTKSTGATKRYFIDGGFAQVRGNVVTVLTDHAYPAESLDVEAASGRLEKALSVVATTDHDQAEKTRSVTRARAEIRVGSRKS